MNLNSEQTIRDLLSFTHIVTGDCPFTYEIGSTDSVPASACLSHDCFLCWQKALAEEINHLDTEQKNKKHKWTIEKSDSDMQFKSCGVFEGTMQDFEELKLAYSVYAEMEGMDEVIFRFTEIGI